MRLHLPSATVPPNPVPDTRGARGGFLFKPHPPGPACVGPETPMSPSQQDREVTFLFVTKS